MKKDLLSLLKKVSLITTATANFFLLCGCQNLIPNFHDPPYFVSRFGTDRISCRLRDSQRHRFRTKNLTPSLNCMRPSKGGDSSRLSKSALDAWRSQSTASWERLPTRVHATEGGCLKVRLMVEFATSREEPRSMPDRVRMDSLGHGDQEEPKDLVIEMLPNGG